MLRRSIAVPTRHVRIDGRGDGTAMRLIALP